MRALMQPLAAVAGFPELQKELVENRGVIGISGTVESQDAHLAAGLAGSGPILLIAENEQKAGELYEDFRLYDRDVCIYPARDMIFEQAELSGNQLGQKRLAVIKALLTREKLSVITSAGGCLDYLLPIRMFKERMIHMTNTDLVDIDSFADQLAAIGYVREAEVELPGQFAIRGGIIDVFSLTEPLPFRIELWGDEVDSIRSFDPESQRSIENLLEIDIFPASEHFSGTESSMLRDSLLDYFPEDAPIVVFEPARVLETAQMLYDEYRSSVEHRNKKDPKSSGEVRMMDAEMLRAAFERRNTVALSMLPVAKGVIDIKKHLSLDVRQVPSYNNQFPLLVRDLQRWKKNGYAAVLLSASHTRAKRLAGELLDEGLSAFYSEDETRELFPGEIMVCYGNARRGFEYPMQRFVLITETDIFGRVRKKRRRRKNVNAVRSFAELSIGDYVIHESHGLGIYRGIEQVEVDGTTKDYIKIAYAGTSHLFLPATQLDLLQKYADAEGKKPRLHKLGGTEWKRTKRRVRESVKNIAHELVTLYAARQKKSGYRYGPDTVWQREFEELFPFDETDDQLSAIEETKRDMESTKIMDRLICGDVGFGKTEVAIRAAFKAVQENKQVVLLAPTTILAQQHFNTFVQRMKDYPLRIDLLSRFRTASQQRQTIADLRKGAVDIVIGTHRVLSKDVAFKDLGLLIIDEEQRFGVAHKERIKQLKESVDVLSLTATPIPRTLHMSLVGIRDMSLLTEAPQDRMPIQTYVSEYDEEMVREAISRELARGGQIYYVYNRVNDIADVAGRVARLCPQANVAFAHGQMHERELERIMYDFIEGAIDVLVSTTIIETGMDIPNVNTIIVHDAERMGLSQLYQLRGRVGRSNRTAYAFLMYRRNRYLKEEAEKRLKAISEFTELGSGVRIAMRDLEIRGAGNLLGAEQHGHMEAVGYELYCKLLKDAVSAEQGAVEEEQFETSVDLMTDAYIPDSYIPDERQKLDIYKRIASIEDAEEADNMTDELLDRYGDPPASVRRLIEISELRSLAHSAYITDIKESREQIRISLYEKAKLNAAGFGDLVASYRGRLRFSPIGTPRFSLEKKGIMHEDAILSEIRTLLDALLKLAER